MTVDVKALFTNIKHKEGAKATKEALNLRHDKTVPTGFIMRILEFVLNNNIFEFDGQLYSQDIGAAMETKPAPPYANIFMAKIDQQILNIAENYKENGQFPVKFMKRFLDDIFKVFIGSTQKLHKFLDEMNSINPDIQFTMTHTSIPGEDKEVRCDCPPRDSIPFLDTSVQIKNRKIEFDLYRKPTDKKMYLLPNSCHAMPYKYPL